MRDLPHAEERRALSGSRLFAGLPEALLGEVADRARRVTVPGGGWLMRQGDEGDAAYAVVSGRLEVVVEEPPPRRVVADLRRGDSVGELALLTGAPRTASVHALRDSELLEIGRDPFMRLLGDRHFAQALLRTLGHLLTAPPRDDGRAPRPHVLTIMRAGGRLPWDRLLTETWRAASTMGRTALLAGPEAGDTLAGYGRLLDNLERAHELVVLVCGDPGDPPEWNAFCARQADRVVAVGAGDDIAPAPEGCELVLVHEAGGPAVPVARWLDVVRPRAHHLVEAGPELGAGVERALRRILGRSVGVVLSGGGARAFVHLGVLERLQAGGVVVDRYGGTSMGAFLSALAAVGGTAADAVDVCRREWVQARPLSDYTVPRRALIRGDRALAMLDRVFGDRRAEELGRDWFAVSADLLAAEPLVHRRGSVAEAVGASMRLPGLVPPLVAGGRLLVDGGVLNNMPVDVMAERDEGPVIAIDAMSQRVDERHIGRALGITEILARSAMLGSVRAAGAHKARAGLVVTPRIPPAGLLEFGRLDELVEAGRRAGEEALEDALALAR